MFYALAVFNVFIAAVAQMMLKKSALQKHFSIVGEYFNLWVIGGYFLFVASLVLNVVAMGGGVLLKDIGAIGATSYLFIPILAMICFKEKFNKKQMLAILLIILGSIIFFL